MPSRYRANLEFITAEQRRGAEDLLMTLASPDSNMNDNHAAEALAQFRRQWLSDNMYSAMKIRVGPCCVSF